MADYALVKDEDGEVHGLWLREADKADNKSLVTALLSKHDITMPDKVRVIPNSYNDKGGAFCMFGSAKAPGEE